MKTSLRAVVSIVARAFTVALLAGVSFPLSCASSDAPACERNSDCERAYCLAGSCRQDCVDGALDCPKGYSCSLIGKCEFDPGSAGAAGAAGVAGGAGTTTFAGSGGAGAGGASGKGGAGQSSGGAGQGGAGAAQGGAGAEQGGAGAEQGGAGASAGSGGAGSGGAPFGGGGESGGPPFGGGGSSGGSAGASGGKGVELDACGSDGDCGSGLLCRANYKGGQKMCTRACASSADCQGGRRCELIDGANVCVSGDIGKGCNVADACNFACLLGQKYCTSTCKTGADCPNGYACQPVGTPAQYVCAKVAVACDADASGCIAPAACDKSLVVSSCTAACTTPADCPQRAPGFAPWTCDGLCRRPPDVKGPLEGGTTPTQYACDQNGAVVNLCNDAQHIDFEAFTIPTPPAVNCSSPTTTSGIDTDSCIDSCRPQGGCPWGFTCTGVGNLGNARIGLCLASGGGGAIGASCKSGLECAFGYCTAAGQCTRDCTVDGLCPTGSSCQAAGGPTFEGLPFRRCQ